MSEEVKITGEDINEAVREWIRGELREGPRVRHGLGKFLFGVSTGSIGLLVSLAKFAGLKPHCSRVSAASIALLLLSAALALWCSIPPITTIGEDTDLLRVLNQRTKGVGWFVWSWFATWMIGVVCGCIAVFAV